MDDFSDALNGALSDASDDEFDDALSDTPNDVPDILPNVTLPKYIEAARGGLYGLGGTCPTSEPLHAS